MPLHRSDRTGDQDSSSSAGWAVGVPFGIAAYHKPPGWPAFTTRIQYVNRGRDKAALRACVW